MSRRSSVKPIFSLLLLVSSVFVMGSRRSGDDSTYLWSSSLGRSTNVFCAMRGRVGLVWGILAGVFRVAGHYSYGCVLGLSLLV